MNTYKEKQKNDRFEFLDEAIEALNDPRTRTAMRERVETQIRKDIPQLDDGQIDWYSSLLMLALAPDHFSSTFKLAIDAELDKGRLVEPYSITIKLYPDYGS